MALDAAFQAFNAQESLASRVVDLSLIPSQVTLQDINSLIRAHGQNDSLNTLRTTQAVLEARPELVSDASMRSTALETLSLVAELVYPTLDATQDGDNTNYGETSHRASIGVDIIHLISSQDGLDLPPPAIIALAAYTNQDDRWSDHELAESAQELLDRAFGGDDSGSGTKLQTFILDKVLQGFLRPLFSKSRPATVTASGRKAEFVQPSRYDNFNADAEANKPWKYQQRYAVTVFSWAVDHTDHETLRKNWHQYTPVLLTLLDETSTPFKLRALATFRIFWDKCPPEIMQQTGLTQVFEDAIFPAVLYLPGLTPEEESMQILDATYPALFAIAGVGSGHRRLEQLSDKQRRLLHRIVREGVLTAYHHSGAEHLRIAEVLCRQLRRVVNGMGILAVKHLKDMIPMLSAIISDPFAPSHPPSLAAALDALAAVQGSCWPRMPHYANDLIQMLMLCWMGIEEAQQEEEEGKVRTESEAKFQDVVDKLRHNARMLGAILEAARASADGDGPADAGASARSTDTGPEGAAVAASRQAASALLDEGADIPGFRATLAERVQPLVEKHKSLGRLFMADDVDA